MSYKRWLYLFSIYSDYIYSASTLPSGSCFTPAAPVSHSWSCDLALADDGLAALFTQRFSGIESSASEQLNPIPVVGSRSFFCAPAAAACTPLGEDKLVPDVEVECEGATGTGRCLPTTGCPQLNAESSLAVWAGKGATGDIVVVAHINKDCDFW